MVHDIYTAVLDKTLLGHRMKLKLHLSVNQQNNTFAFRHYGNCQMGALIAELLLDSYCGMSVVDNKHLMLPIFNIMAQLKSSFT